MSDSKLVCACMLISLRLISKESGSDRDSKSLDTFLEDESTYKLVNTLIQKEPQLAKIIDKDERWAIVTKRYRSCFKNEIFSEKQFYFTLNQLLKNRSEEEEQIFINFITKVVLYDNNVSLAEKEVISQLIHQLNIKHDNIPKAFVTQSENYKPSVLKRLMLAVLTGFITLIATIFILLFIQIDYLPLSLSLLLGLPILIFILTYSSSGFRKFLTSPNNNFVFFKKVITDENTLDHSWQKFLSLAFMTVAGSICFMSFANKWLGVIPIGAYSFKPDFTSTLLTFLLISPLYARKILKWSFSIYGIISFVLISLVFSSFVQLIMGGKSLAGLELANPRYFLLMLALILSWLGIRSVAGAAWILLLISIFMSINKVNQILGTWGFTYVLTSILGLSFHAQLSPAAMFIHIKDEFLGQTQQIRSRMQEDISEAGSVIKNNLGGML